MGSHSALGNRTLVVGIEEEGSRNSRSCLDQPWCMRERERERERGRGRGRGRKREREREDLAKRDEMRKEMEKSMQGCSM